MSRRRVIRSANNKRKQNITTTGSINVVDTKCDEEFDLEKELLANDAISVESPDSDNTKLCEKLKEELLDMDDVELTISEDSIDMVKLTSSLEEIILEKDKLPAKAPEKKRGPGRPRKNPKKKQEKILGISKTPKTNNSNMEFEYHIPITFKKIWSFFKSIHANKIHINFRPNDIILYTTDFRGNSQVRIRILCKNVMWYYLGNESIDIGINRSDTDGIMNKIDKNYQRIYIIARKHQIGREIRIVLLNERKITEIHDVKLTHDYKSIINESEFLNIAHAVKFDMSATLFKKTFNDIASMRPGSKITYIKEGLNEPLMLEYTSDNTKVASRIIYKGVLLNMKTNMSSDSNLRMSFDIDHVKPIASSQFTEKVTICVDEIIPMIFFGEADGGTVELRVLNKSRDEEDE